MIHNFTKDDFIENLKQHDIMLNDKQIHQFEVYANMLVEWNQKMNLTAITNIDEIYEKHFLDSILPSFKVEMKGSLCDVGAGAGFPSIPLKIIYPELDVTIVEPLGKRVVFLKALCEELDIQVNCINERAEDYAKIKRESFDLVSARAVANLVMLSELCIPLVKKEGIFLAMKGSNAREEVTMAKRAIEILGCKLEDSFTEFLSDGSIRMNIVFRKVKATAMKYPRAFAKIKKQPL